MKQRKLWVDLVKAVCMLCVYILHSEVYYGTGGVSWGRIVTPFYVNGFFFVSGYLWFAKNLNSSEMVIGGGNRNLSNWFFRLVVPTVLFATVFYVPKMLFHGQAIYLSDYIFAVWGGVHYWFTSALAVAELTLMAVLWCVRCRDVYLWTFGAGVVFMVCVVANNANGALDAPDYFPWFWRIGLTYTFIMALGGLYGRYEQAVERLLRTGLWVLLVSYVAMIIVFWHDDNFKIIGMYGCCNVSGFMTMMVGMLLLVCLSKRVRQIGVLGFIGRQSIVFYFLSGVMPAAVGNITAKVCAMLGVERCYAITLVVAFVSVMMSFAVAKALERYAPWSTDLRRLWQKGSVTNCDKCS